MLKTEVRAQRVYLRNAIEIVVLQPRPNGKLAVAQPLILDEADEGLMITEPTFTLKIDEAQLLIDELWNCGIRPSEGSGSTGSLRATEKHLNDMQSIAKGLLKKDGVEI